jgi:TonB family protein
MKRLDLAFSLIVLTGAVLFAAMSVAASSLANYQAPEIAQAGEVNYPPNSVAYGIVVLDVTVDAGGEVQDVQAVRDVVSLTPEAIRAVKGWKFRPARLNGKPIRSRTAIAVAFSPRLNNPPDAALPPLPGDREGQNRTLRFSPPRVTKGTFPKYPIRSIAWGTVVLQVEIGASGRVDATKTIRGIASLTPEAIRAAKHWQFEPAMLDGRRVPGKATLAFLFRPPIHSIR